jgi:DNA-binding CsgD family transcriptional regulator
MNDPKKPGAPPPADRPSTTEPPPSSAPQTTPKNLRVEYSGDGQTVAILSFDVDDADKAGDLTSAEREVALLALGGKSNNEIAEARHCSVRTVANQLQSVFRKLGIRSRAELAAKASIL